MRISGSRPLLSQQAATLPLNSELSQQKLNIVLLRLYIRHSAVCAVDLDEFAFCEREMPSCGGANAKVPMSKGRIR